MITDSTEPLYWSGDYIQQNSFYHILVISCILVLYYVHFFKVFGNSSISYHVLVKDFSAFRRTRWLKNQTATHLIMNSNKQLIDLALSTYLLIINKHGSRKLISNPFQKFLGLVTINVHQHTLGHK